MVGGMQVYCTGTCTLCIVELPNNYLATNDKRTNYTNGSSFIFL